ncbi:helix-turn-helix domain-containing protein [Shinella sp. CPCC 101442]|uniref:helix-turn-helix domain-containing protein n=1 Tax=Shinella sp. CPCC 101442 TaxID=2932265 RepID=UPI002152A4EC|nr:helix-turn-helix domain-containing protein [Shinella sp. CPCC 101442]MCR6500631.1 helix-turn-helix domain-containing protein [Shinella sp. CPCC 101442]
MTKSVPTYDLYGERAGNRPDFWLHCETIPSRSSLHRYEIGLHRHESFFQILYISAGSGDARFGKETVTLAPPAIVTVPPAVGHGFRFSRDVDGHVFTMLASHLRLAGEAGRFAAEPRVTPLDAGDPDSAFVLATLERLAGEWAQRRSGRTDLMEAYLVSVLTLTARLWSRNSSNEEAKEGAGETARRMEHLNGLIQQHFRSQKPAQFYAREIGVSPTHLNRIVKVATGLTAHAYIARKLIDEAKRALVFTEMPAQEVGLVLGFADAAYFSRYFLRAAGATPRAFRLAERARLSAQSSE